MKRYQECNFIEKLWRSRWKLTTPFLFLYHSILDPLKIYDPELNTHEVVKGKNLWKLLQGIIDMKMKHFYTSEEIKEKITLRNL